MEGGMSLGRMGTTADASINKIDATSSNDIHINNNH